MKLSKFQEALGDAGVGQDLGDAEFFEHRNEIALEKFGKKSMYTFLIVAVICYVLFVGAMLCYRYGFVETLKVDRKLIRASSYLQGLISEHTFIVAVKTFKCLFTCVAQESEFSSVPATLDLQDLGMSIGSVTDYDLDEDINGYAALDDAKAFRDEIIAKENESQLYESAWNMHRLDDNFFRMVLLAFHDLTGLSNQIGEWCLKEHERQDELRTIISHSVMLFLMLVIIFFGAFTIVTLMNRYAGFQTLKSLIMLLPMDAFMGPAANIVARFKTKKKKDANDGQFRSRYIVKHSMNPIIVTDALLQIQFVNNATVDMFGYDRDNLIHKDLDAILKKKEGRSGSFTMIQFIQQQGLSPESESALPEVDLMAVPAQGDPVPVNCTIIPFRAESSSGSPAFAAILRDVSSIERQKNNVEEAKDRVKTLLHKIMPKVMARKLESHDPVLHSQVERATFCFVAIYKFTDWCQTHTHVEIMNFLDKIVSEFDRMILKYESLVKIKIINGVYMAAGGLFEDSATKPHEVEMVQFGEDCIRWMRERNRLTNEEFHLQIGVHTGGPIIAGVLGRDKPFFDVYGDSVNMAARLETSCWPLDCIHISEETKHWIEYGLEVEIEERPDTVLKGKGKLTTYIIHVPE